MAEILNSKIVLRLNANWMRIGWATPAEAFVALMSGSDAGDPPALAIECIYELDADGQPITDQLVNAIPHKWEDWMKLPIRPWDITIGTKRGPIRVPTVLVCPKFNKMPMKTLRPTKHAIRDRDKNRCVYTGQLLTNKTASIDHVLPKSKGGRDTWTNLVLCHKDVNTKKGNKLNDEAGLKLLTKPFEPQPIPLCSLIKDTKHPDHVHF